jgi:predicted RNA-binding protein associated with RNAse of E/G family
VTLARGLSFRPPLTIGDQIALEEGSLAVWLTFPGRWYDVGLFHRADGTRSGIYGNVLTPPTIASDGRWDTTDLFLDLWIPAGGEPVLLDEDELMEAEALGAVEREIASRARSVGERILEEAVAGLWPPKPTSEWTLERALAEEADLVAAGAPTESQ